MSQRSACRSVAAFAGMFASMAVLSGIWAAPAGKSRAHSLAGDLGPMPVSFVAAGVQAGAGAGFRVQGTGKTISFSRGGLAFAVDRPHPAPGLPRSEPCLVNLDFFGAREDAVPEGLEGTETNVRGSGPKLDAKETGKVFSRIMYRSLWPGIDLVFKGGTNRLTYEFIVRPGADPSQIKLVYRGAEAIALTKEGRLAIRTPAGDFEEDVPAGYQEIGGLRNGVAVTFSLEEAAGSQGPDSVPVSGGTSGQGLERPVIAVKFDVGPYVRTETLVLDTAGGYFGRKTGTTSIEVTGGHAGGSKFNLPTGQWIARMGILGYMQNSPADGTLAIYKDTATPDIKQYVCHTVTGPLPVGPANKAWTVLEVAGGPVWLDPGDYWILRNDSGNWANKFVITGEALDSNKWGWCFIDYPAWPQNTQYRTWVENF